jgi:predicted transcriptional regulator
VARNYSEAKKKIAQKLGLAEKLAEGRKKRGKK